MRAWEVSSSSRSVREAGVNWGMERGISLLGKLLRFSGGDVGLAASLSALKGERPTMTQGRGQVTRGISRTSKDGGILPRRHLRAKNRKKGVRDRKWEEVL